MENILIAFFNKIISKYPIEHPVYLLFIPAFLFIINYYVPYNFGNNWVFFVILSLGLFFLWSKIRNIPKLDANKVGILIGISTENEEEEKKLKDNFIDNVRDQISSYGYFKLIVLRNYHTNKILSERDRFSKEYLRKTGCVLIVFGKCINSMVDGKKHYILKLDATAKHKRIPIDRSKSFAIEMRKVLPSKTLIPFDNEFIGFEVASHIVEYAAIYIVGVASFYSDNLLIALNTHKNLFNRLNKLEGELESEGKKNFLISQLKDLTKKILHEEAVRLVKYYYELKNLIEMEKYINLIEEVNVDDYETHLLKSIFYFIKSRDIEKALKEIDLAENNTDFTWLYNKAFIVAYIGKLNEAFHFYKRAFKGYTQEHVVLQVESFIYDILEIEPHKYQLYYCLGLINYFKKEDFDLAKENLDLFIEMDSKNNGKFKENTEYASKYIEDIDNINRNRKKNGKNYQ
jgi:tetratricopeptide (TPR) repeat protein